MSFKLALLFVVCFLALAGAIPVEKTEDEDTKLPEPLAAEPEKEATEEDPAPEDNEDENESEDQSQEDTNDEGKEDEDNEDEEEPETDDKEEEPENEVEAKEEDENVDVKRGSRYAHGHPRCKFVRKRVRGCRYRLRCTGSLYRGRGRCCRKYRHCGYYYRRVRICQKCRRRCRRVCRTRRRRVCQRVRGRCVWRHRRRGRYYRRYQYCRYINRCYYIPYKFCQIRCSPYRCYWPGG